MDENPLIFQKKIRYLNLCSNKRPTKKSGFQLWMLKLKKIKVDKKISNIDFFQNTKSCFLTFFFYKSFCKHCKLKSATIGKKSSFWYETNCVTSEIRSN